MGCSLCHCKCHMVCACQVFGPIDRSSVCVYVCVNVLVLSLPNHWTKLADLWYVVSKYRVSVFNHR